MAKNSSIAIIDYKMSNLFSIKNALDTLGIKNEITSDEETILSSSGAILPGVGSFPESMQQLSDLKLVDTIKRFIDTGKPFMGICLGLQLLFTKSDEFQETKGLGIIDGTVQSFKSYIKEKPIPHVGWNKIQRRNLGFLYAYDQGADVVATVDDDNIPYENWGEDLYIGKKLNVIYGNLKMVILIL